MHVYLTIDTEISAGLFQMLGKDATREVFDRSITGRTPTGDVGVGYQMDVFEKNGLKGVFFVDPMPALVMGESIIQDIVGPIVERGHDVQLHMHTEWLAFAKESPVEGRVGSNIKDFSLEDQAALIGYAAGVLVNAGAPQPVAFRAGNYGASDDTLRALALNGIKYDTSFCPGIAQSQCAISLSRNITEAVEHCGVVEVPIGAIKARGEKRRHAQITALSSHEMMNALRHAEKIGRDSYSIVSHSFEMMARDRYSKNEIVRRRFERFCQDLSEQVSVVCGTYAHFPPKITDQSCLSLLPHSPVRSILRMFEQALSNALYGSK